MNEGKRFLNASKGQEEVASDQQKGWRNLL